jgi:phosphatidylglycerol:prolipoprotein diacylglycerol transferase
MLDTLLRIPIPGTDWSIPIHGYGLMLVIGFFAALEIAKRLGPRVGVKAEWFQNALLIAIVAGVVGSRLSHVLENWSIYTDPKRSFSGNFFAAINITSGGLTFYGGLILAGLCVFAYAVWSKIPVRPTMDAAAPAIVVGLAFGRIGCLLHGCCYGGVCSPDAVPWAVQFPYGSPAYVAHVEAEPPLVTPPPQLVRDGRLVPPASAERDPVMAPAAEAARSRHVHPAQIYSSINAFLLTAMLAVYFFVPHVAGRGFAWMLMLAGSSRFLLETLRAEPAVAGNFSFSMIVGLLLVVLGAVLWFVFGRVGGTLDLRNPVEPATT